MVLNELRECQLLERLWEDRVLWWFGVAERHRELRGERDSHVCICMIHSKGNGFFWRFEPVLTFALNIHSLKPLNCQIVSGEILIYERTPIAKTLETPDKVMREILWKINKNIYISFPENLHFYQKRFGSVQIFIQGFKVRKMYLFHLLFPIREKLSCEICMKLGGYHDELWLTTVVILYRCTALQM